MNKLNLLLIKVCLQQLNCDFNTCQEHFLRNESINDLINAIRRSRPAMFPFLCFLILFVQDLEGTSYFLKAALLFQFSAFMM